jgi:molybdopterin molybdotransferase
MKTNVSVEEAIELLINLANQKGIEDVPITKALNMVLAEDIHAKISLPPFDKSPLDGFALRGEDTKKAGQGNPVFLKITEEISAGRVPSCKVMPGTAAKILTGAPIPEGANAVVRYEETQWDKECVQISTPIDPYMNIIYKGEEIQKGDLILEKGTFITPAVIGMLVSQGIDICKVYKRPLVAVITTGDEIAEPGKGLKFGKIYNSNLYTISAFIRHLGLECIEMGNVADDVDKIADMITEALDKADIVITTGGASVGDYDYAISSLEKLKAEILFWKVRMKPGMATLAACKDGKLIVGLSGNPGAAILAMMRIVYPYLLKSYGRRDYLPEEIDVILKKDVNKKSPIPRLLRGRLMISNGQAFFDENIGQGNNMLKSFLDFDLVAEIPAGSPPLSAGTMIKAYRY